MAMHMTVENYADFVISVIIQVEQASWIFLLLQE